jgi:hypothetical protein
MSEQEDPFTGTWRFNPHRSTLSTLSPQSWVQQIIATRGEVHVHETIIRLQQHLHSGAHVAASGIAVFEKDAETIV